MSLEKDSYITSDRYHLVVRIIKNKSCVAVWIKPIYVEKFPNSKEELWIKALTQDHCLFSVSIHVPYL